MDKNNTNNMLIGGGGGRKMSNPPPFLLKTYMLVDDPEYDAVISWNDVGSGFVVWQPAEFARDLLPTLFKHSNFSSFVRQLNTYGFKKVATNRWEFNNEMFQKGKKELLNQIHRRKAWSNRQQPPTPTTAPKDSTTPKESSATLQNNDDDQRSWSTSSSSELSTLVDENKRLKQENGVLSSELTTMRRKCNDLLELVADYANQTAEIERESDQKQPMLFGVRLDVNGEERKRKRSLEIYETARVLLSQSCK